MPQKHVITTKNTQHYDSAAVTFLQQWLICPMATLNSITAHQWKRSSGRAAFALVVAINWPSAQQAQMERQPSSLEQKNSGNGQKRSAMDAPLRAESEEQALTPSVAGDSAQINLILKTSSSRVSTRIPPNQNYQRCQTKSSSVSEQIIRSAIVQRVQSRECSASPKN